MPEMVIGDLNAQIAALRTGARRFEELYEKYGERTVRRCIDAVLDHGERTAREAVESLPDGTWRAVGHADGTTQEQDDLIRIEIAVTIDGDTFTVDFAGSSDAIDAPLNIPYGMTDSIVKLCFKSITTPSADSNEGQYRPVVVDVPEGNLFNAEYPHPTFTLWPAILAVDVIYEALSGAIPETVAASSGSDLCDIMLYGDHPDTGRGFVEANNEGIGWGASHEHDGPNASMHITETMVRNIPIEVFENKAPIRFDELALREDSGGPGEHRGGLGIRRVYEFTHPTGALSITQKMKTAGWGMEGGSPGSKNVVVLDLNDGWEERIQVLVDNDALYDATDEENRKYVGMFRGTFQPGEVISNRSGGGGGYGDPYDRDPEAVLEDVIDGYVTPEAAREQYGVVVTEDHDLAWDATLRQRRDR